MVSNLYYLYHLLTGLIHSLVDSYNPHPTQQIFITLELRSCYSKFKSCQGLPTALKIHFHTLDWKAVYIRVLVYFFLYFMSYSNLFLFCSLVTSCVQLFCDPHGLQPARFLCPWDSSRQEYWSGLSLPSPGDLPNSGIKPMSPALASRLFTIEPPGKLLLGF